MKSSFLSCVLFSLISLSAVKAETTLYVAPSGNDAWSGDKDRPLASLAGARNRVRETIAAGLSAPVTVLIRGGEYSMAETVVFSPEDSGTEAFPVTYQAFEGEEPIFTGGPRLTGWKPVETDPEGVSEVAKGKLWYWEMPPALKGKWKITSLYEGLRLMPRAESDPFRVSPKHVADVANAQPKDLRRFAQENGIDLLNHQGPPVVFRRDFKFSGDDLKDWKNVSDIEIKSRQRS